jgi:predicted DCC family thiol-disulfide oxidoreductase YuxK
MKHQETPWPSANPPLPVARTNGIVLFDGVCNLCNGAVRFIIKYDPDGRFLFAPLQSQTGQDLIRAYAIPPGVDSVILIKGNRAYTGSEAALLIARGLTGLWPLLWGFIIIPPPLRDAVYRWIARNRYRWFGKRDQCMLPTPAQQARFLNE